MHAPGSLRWRRRCRADVVAVLTAVWFGDEAMTGMEWAGGALITLAAFVEAIDSSPTPQPQGT